MLNVIMSILRCLLISPLRVFLIRLRIIMFRIRFSMFTISHLIIRTIISMLRLMFIIIIIRFVYFDYYASSSLSYF